MKPKIVKFDKKRPVFFGFAAIAKFEELTGAKMAEMDKVLSEGKVADMIAFAFSGVYGGAKKEKLEIDFDIDDVANWLDDIEDLEQLFAVYMDCMPMVKSGTATKSGAKKKLK
jgi:hypothetical protein